MMEFVLKMFGEGKELNATQMCCRGIVVFLLALILIRISGRRSFGLKTPLDNIIAILLGAILSRAVVGASPFLPIVCTCLFLVIIHRYISWLTSHYKPLSKLIEGEKILLFDNGRFHIDNMKKALVQKEDIMQAVRKSALTDQLDLIDRIYMERNGEISALKKKGA